MDLAPTRAQTTALAAIGAGEAIGQESRWIATSGQSQTSGWTGAVASRVSAVCGEIDDMGGKYRAPLLHLHRPR